MRLHRVAASVAQPYITQAVTFATRRAISRVRSTRRDASASIPPSCSCRGPARKDGGGRPTSRTRSRRHGVVALSYDKRGVGGSGGDWRTATFDDLAADARAGVHLLARRADVDPSRLGVYGHSQGGFLGPMIAETIPSDVDRGR